MMTLRNLSLFLLSFALMSLAIACDDEGSSNDPADLDVEQDQAEEVSEDTSDTSQDESIDEDIPDQGEDLKEDGPEDLIEDEGADEEVAEDVQPDEHDTNIGPIEGNVIPNWGFEEWEDGDPVSWLGMESNLYPSWVTQESASPYSGDYACQLSNPDPGHLRFTTAPLSLPQGRYFCSMQARGDGEIRLGVYAFEDHKYGSYITLSGDEWRSIEYDFNVREDTNEDLEVILSLRNASLIVVDHVACVRQDEPCDSVVCEDWQVCNNATVECEPASGFCGDAEDCNEGQTCNADHICELQDGRCSNMADCDVSSATPVCDYDTHTCVSGDPCEGVTCDEWQTCDPDTAHCVLTDGRCYTTRDCLGALPACDDLHHCVGADDDANVVPNGGFEEWATMAIPYHGDNWLPLEWYGTFEDLSDPTAATEIDPAWLIQFTDSTHSGTSALQVTQTAEMNADRFASEDFDLPPGHYTCVYWVKGKGTVRHRTYGSGLWSTWTDFVAIDSDEWTPIFFEQDGNIAFFRLVFYISNTDPASDHILLDDVVCTKDP